MKVNNNLIRRITSVCVVAALVFMFSVLPFTASAEKVTDLSITIQSAIYNPSTSASYVSVRDTLLNNETYNLASVEENIPMDYSTRVSLDMVFNKQDKSILAFADEAFTINISNLAYGVWIAGVFYSVNKVDHSNYQLQLNYTDGTIGYINSGISWTYNPNNETHQISFDVLPEKDVSSIRFWESIRQYDFTHIHGKYLSYVTMGSGDYPLSIVVDIETLTDSRLEGIEDKLDDQNQKLDGVQDSIETLPGEIGDQFQNIMDSEKDNAKGEGNKFVDQVLDKLPDPSQGILSALGDLTSSINYTGTAATLAIPAIVLPSIDGLFPETEIWSGTEFSFSEYVEMMPSGLLTLVKSLFTIAIVLFCVYELKGIISYCLTLREKDGG